MLCSNWTVTWGGETLLSLGDWLRGELALDSTKPLEVVSLVRSDRVKVFDRGNVARAVGFTVLYKGASAEAARNWALARVKAVEALGVGPMVITPKDGTAESFAGMGCGRVSVEFPDGGNELAGDEVWVSYEFVGG